MDNEDKELVEVTQQAITSWVVNPYIQAATSDNTRKAYRHDVRHYENWGGRLPATPEQIVRYLEAFAPTLNPRTLARRIIALRHWHTYQGFTDPTQHPVIKKTLSGILRIHGKPKDKARALSLDEMKQISLHLQQEGSLSSLRDHALLLIGFFGALRRSELVAIYMEHISWKEEGLEIMLPSSKTDQIHEGQFCVIPRGTHDICPVTAMEKWINELAIKSGPIFTRIMTGEQIGEHPLTPLSVNHILKRRAIEAGLKDTDSLSSHSMRRGLATSAAQAGAPLQAIMRAGRWKQTNTVMEYIEAGERFTDSAAGLLLK